MLAAVWPFRPMDAGPGRFWGVPAWTGEADAEGCCIMLA